MSLIFVLFSYFSLANENPLTGIAAISNYQLEAGKPFTISVELQLPEGYRAYADKFQFTISEPDGFRYQSFTINPLQTFYDENTKKKKVGIIKNATLTIPAEAPAQLDSGEHKMKMAITYQACTKTFCLFPKVLNLEIPFSFSAGVSIAPEAMPIDFQSALNKGLVWAFFAAFVAGFLTSLTPCVFPMIPITISILGRNAHLHSKRKNFLLALLYVLGIAVTYAALGVFAAGSGVLFGSFMAHPAVLSFICIVFFAMSLSMFGLFELQAPSFIRNRFAGDLHLHGYSSAFIYGVIAGVIASPCVGPVLVGILTFIAKSQNLWLGFWLMFVFAIGMGVLFIALGISSQLTKLLPKSGAWMESVKYFFGIVLLGLFFYYFHLLVPIKIWKIALGVAIVILSSVSGAFENVSEAKMIFKIRKGLCQMFIFVGAAVIVSTFFDLHSVQTEIISQEAQVEWKDFSAEELSKAKSAQRPVLIDFWAEWCGACKQLDRETFSTEEFKKIAQNFTLLKFNATTDSEQLQKLKSQYEIVGLPTLILINSDGLWQKQQTVTEFVTIDKLSEKMKKLIK